MVPRIGSSFVGREAERDAIASAFRSGARLVTLSGPAGVGKTRLALEHAARHPGARLCALEDVEDRDGLLDAVAAAFGVEPQAGGTRGGFLRQIGDALDARGDALVVVDSPERAIRAVAPTIATWLAETRRPRFLVASRELLGLPDERTLEVTPLPRTPSSPRGRSDAVQLFCDRASAARAGWEPRGEDLAGIAALVEALDGLPLAIELAAARVAVLSPAEIAARLDRRLDVLVSASRGGSPRQRTLRTALDASWDELDLRERAALAQLSVFRGGFATTIAEEVLDLPASRDAAGVVESLRRKSLLWARPREDGQLRLGMLESIRVYAAEQLASSGQEGRLRARHAEVLLRHGRAWAAGVQGPDGPSSLGLLAQERENLLAVLRWAGEAPGRGALAVEAVLVLDELLATREPAESHLAMLDGALRAAGLSVEPAVRAGALLARARVAATLGRAPAAARDAAAALRIAAAHDLRELRAEALVARGGIRYMTGRMADARGAFRAARAVARRIRSRRVEAAALTGLAAVVHVQGQTTLARRLNERALALQVALGERARQGRTLARLGFLHLDCGELEDARRCYGEALEIHRAFGARGAEAIVLGYLGNLERQRGDLEGARARYHAALSILKALGHRPFEPVILMDEGIALLDADRPEDAALVLEAALERLARARNVYLETLVRGYLAVALAERDALGAAARMLRLAARHGGSARGPLAAVLRLQRCHLAIAAARAGTRSAERTRRAALSAARRALAAASRHRSEHVRLVRGMLARAVERLDPPADALVLAEDGAWFVPPRGARVDLANRESLRRLLGALAGQWRLRGGAALSADALFAQGWPGERATPAAARNRVRVGLATLRALGLRSVLVTGEGGYLLRTTARVVLTPAPGSGAGASPRTTV